MSSSSRPEVQLLLALEVLVEDRLGHPRPDRDLLHGRAVEAVLGEHLAGDQQELGSAGLGGQAFGRQIASSLMPHLTRDGSGLNITG